ncbi:MAG: DUF6457 domain-containing protein [Actinomycetota bacterium]
MTANWLQEITRAVASTVGQAPDTLTLSPKDVRTLLDLARIAAHTSGDRTNAPLLCYVLGIAHRGGASLDTLSAAVREAADRGAVAPAQAKE